jgi:hypothetical protein
LKQHGGRGATDSKRAAARIAALFLASALAGCGSSPPPPAAVKVSGETYETSFAFSPVSPYAAVPLVKDFTAMGLVTVTKTVVSGNAAPVVYKNSPITYAGIMAEAARLGADTVINIVTGLETEISAAGEPLKAAFTGSKPGLEPNKRVTITEKYTATALAIKYGDMVNASAGGTAPFGGPGNAALPESRRGE